ncbi:chorismate mutase [Sulfolobus islandicus Y.G.57.14]|jgi:chorismate mutase/prephenate dehydrogenase|uniref:Chorismate mutase n=9 Tax=Saccharolobus islandicus TaxID=43080 RepID=C3MRC1_SACI2|nr:chorismate mutase [Sulfolobus islandicus]ACP35934.1 chorismate mutase [Sulfolobus islandicus L.S.2.15]ACP38544.1 chorismate mutase [Sulfolobus islandicus M.14.25]ACP46172.1 chorismate mutase [Sulfolobus islandicus Y.G.57.14]ACP48116.1 chorismate mutase [Sulfolobus islandicus Y.N.15.51]ACP55788.1 chorismate mutase [Sulfolobus islandicus M.16.27]
MTEEIARLREEIDKVDEQLVKLLSYRLELSRKIGKAKLNSNVSVTDENRETKVRERWISNAKKYNIPNSLVESILPLIFSYSKLVQINPGEKEKVVIYGYGGMARSIVSILSLAGHEVSITGRDLSKAEILANQFKCVSMAPLRAVDWGDIIIFAIPPNVILSNSNELFSDKLKGKVVMDISSSKFEIFKFLEELSRKLEFKYISTHPLFGPIEYPVGERIVIIPSQTSSNNDIIRIENFWRKSGLVPIITDVETHEKAMAIVQVLAHYYLLGLSNAIETLSLELGVEYSNFHTTNFRELNKILKKVKDLKNVIIEIQKQNPYSYKVRNIGLEELKKIKEELEGGK